jgi:hypothetical protein
MREIIDQYDKYIVTANGPLPTTLNVFLCSYPAGAASNIKKAIVVPTDGKKGSGDMVTNLVVNNVVAHKKTNKVKLQPNVLKIYSTLNEISGSMRLNAEFRPIYGESQPGSFQAVVDKMKAYMDLNENSYFIDVGCGERKPNLHAAQDPGVAISICIEVVENRWAVCMKHFSTVIIIIKFLYNLSYLRSYMY